MMTVHLNAAITMGHVPKTILNMPVVDIILVITTIVLLLLPILIQEARLQALSLAVLLPLL